MLCVQENLFVARVIYDLLFFFIPAGVCTRWTSIAFSAIAKETRYKVKRFTVIKEREALNMKGGQRDVCVFCDAILCPFFYSSFIEDNNDFQLIQLFSSSSFFLSFRQNWCILLLLNF